MSKTTILIASLLTLLTPALASAQSASTNSESATITRRGGERTFGFGIQGSFGGRFDNVRLCTATGEGAQGGPAGDIAATLDFGVGETTTLRLRVPVVRPILFAVAFEMLQFEPDVALLWRFRLSPSLALVAGPSLGVVLHYGPDYRSASSGDGRTSSFFAIGPKVGAFVALDWPRRDGAFGVQLGVSPHFAPLFSIDDAQGRRGVVAGGSLDLGLYF